MGLLTYRHKINPPHLGILNFSFSNVCSFLYIDVTVILIKLFVMFYSLGCYCKLYQQLNILFVANIEKQLDFEMHFFT